MYRDIFIEKNTTFEKKFPLEFISTDVFTGRLRLHRQSEDSIEFYIDKLDSEIRISLTSIQTGLLQEKTYIYDILKTDVGGNVSKVFQGNAVVNYTATR